jgi:O-antigen ligase/tetratricopeptide (TPR) repeat protein
MAALSTVFWILGFILSVVIAPQLRVWTWGPTMLCFGVATLLALPVFLRKSSERESLYVLIPGIAISAWIVLRSYFSPVEELATQDLLLVAMAVSTYLVFRAGEGRGTSGNLLVCGIALILGASLWVISRQMMDRSFSPVFPVGEAQAIRGFFGHYSYCASFLIPCSLILGGLALHGGYHFTIRILLLALAIGGVAAVVLTKSRGGVIGVGLGLAALAFGSILIGKREGKRWFAPVAILAPLLFIGFIILFLGVLEDVEQSRSKGSDLTGMLDNTIRFYLLGIAVSCISQHPWLGGGSRSFSWECFQGWDVAAYGAGGYKPEHVHNELVQTVSEYGIVGGSLLLVFLGCVTVAFLAKTLSKDRNVGDGLGDAWRIGGFAGFAGLFAQSQFEGIFRIPPGAILLALCLAAAASVLLKPTEKSQFTPQSVLLAVCALVTMIPLFAYGLKGTKATQAMWLAFFSKEPLPTQDKIGAITHGIAAWPTSPLYHERGTLYRELAAKKSSADPLRKELLASALADFKSASELHPLDPTNLLNQAGTLRLLGMIDAAEPLYRKSIQAQGGMEVAFQANQRFADFLYQKSVAEYVRNDLHSAISTLEIAAKHTERAKELGQWLRSLSDLNLRIYSSLGQALEAAGDPKRALEHYDHAAGLRDGGSTHYLAGLMLGRQATNAWTVRGSEEDALRLFLEAEQRIIKATPLPTGVTPEDRNEYIEYLRRSIRYLQDTNVKPSEKLNF